jgi:hypothetical protein
MIVDEWFWDREMWMTHPDIDMDFMVWLFRDVVT